MSDPRHQHWPASVRPWNGSPFSVKPADSLRADLTPTPADVSRVVKDVVFVDPDFALRRAVEEILAPLAEVETCADFKSARVRLREKTPDLLVTNLRLYDYNGLHLVHLAGNRTRCVVYSTEKDLSLAREAQAVGAFFERANRMPLALPAYVNAKLPRHDQRDLFVLDRRKSPRGGRRSTDR